MQHRSWQVYGKNNQYLGVVIETDDESLARCAALYRFGIDEDEVAAGRRGIGPGDGFSVRRA